MLDKDTVSLGGCSNTVMQAITLNNSIVVSSNVKRFIATITKTPVRVNSYLKFILIAFYII